MQLTKSQLVLKNKIILSYEGITSAPNLPERTNIPLSTVYRVFINTENGECIEHKKGPGMLNVGNRRWLGILVSKNRRASISNIRCEVVKRRNMYLSKETLRRELHSLNW